METWRCVEQLIKLTNKHIPQMLTYFCKALSCREASFQNLLLLRLIATERQHTASWEGGWGGGGGQEEPSVPLCQISSESAGFKKRFPYSTEKRRKEEEEDGAILPPTQTELQRSRVAGGGRWWKE